MNFKSEISKRINLGILSVFVSMVWVADKQICGVFLLFFFSPNEMMVVWRCCGNGNRTNDFAFCLFCVIQSRSQAGRTQSTGYTSFGFSLFDSCAHTIEHVLMVKRERECAARIEIGGKKIILYIISIESCYYLATPSNKFCDWILIKRIFRKIRRHSCSPESKSKNDNRQKAAKKKQPFTIDLTLVRCENIELISLVWCRRKSASEMLAAPYLR